MMDFSFSEDQVSLRELASKLLGDVCTNEHLKAVAATESAVDHDLWKAMADTGLVGIAIPESVGGGGLGFTEACIVLSEAARRVAPVPALGVAIAVEILKQAGAADALDGVASGERIVTAALLEQLGSPRTPSATVTDGNLTGVKTNVPAGLLAAAFVVSAADGLYLVAADAPGVSIERQDTTSGIPEAMVVFTDAPARCVAGADQLDAALDRAETMTCVMMASACDAALRLTADYAVSRKQFERPIASFQAVSQRAADSYIDTEAVKLTAWQAVWRIEHGHPAAAQVATAKFWASEGGNRVMAAAHHIHGGMGVDRDYPLHRFSFLARQLELTFGSATPSLARLGRELAGTPS